MLTPSEVILNSLDWARMVLSSSGLSTRLTLKPLPTGHPPLGALSVVVRRVPSTKAERTWLLTGRKSRS